ncbi:putative reverse transcriptase domain-containing protein, partial [Tanacetum coccineum]
RFQEVKLARIYSDEIIARNGILHPQADGQSESMVRTLEDIMRKCVIDFGGSYHLSIWCAPFKALYGRKCRSPVIWAKIRGSSLIRPELVQETTNKEVLIKEKLKVARDHQKSYTDNRRKPLEFEGKLAPRYVGPIEILERINPARLRLPEELSSVHDTFHVSNLKKCLADASLHVPLNEINVDKTLRFVEELVEIMDREIKKLKRSKITLVKVH